MIESIKRALRPWVGKSAATDIPIHWVRRDPASRLSRILAGDSIRPPRGEKSAQIEEIARQTNAMGPQPLWEGYGGDNVGADTRDPDAVRTDALMGNLYTHLVRGCAPRVMVEFGTAFGVSGMYFLQGMEANGQGCLYTFEPNDVWAQIARKNLAQISDRFRSVVGTFEENVDTTLPASEPIDMAFIDAIHTRAFVVAQLEIVVARCRPGAVVLLDDIGFSDDMRACWEEVAADPRFVVSAALGDRVGIVELRG